MNATDGLTIHIPASKESDQANSFLLKRMVPISWWRKLAMAQQRLKALLHWLSIPPFQVIAMAMVLVDDDGKPVVTIPEATQEDGYTINAKKSCRR